MQTFISKYGLAAHLALLAVTPLFLFPFCTRQTCASSMLWMSLVGFVWMLMEPSRRNDERLHEARVRVRSSLIRDPLFWLFIVIICFTATRALNGDIIRLYDTRAAKWVLSDPKSHLFPRAVEGQGFFAFCLAVAVAVVVTGCRQALGKSARIAFVATVAVVTGLLSLVLVMACRLGHEGVLALAGQAEGLWPEAGMAIDSKLYVSSMGNALGLATLAGVMTLAGLFESGWNKFMLLLSFGVGAAWVGLFCFSTPAVFCLYALLGLLGLAGCYAYLALTQRPVVLLKFTVAALMAAGIATLIAVFLVPREMLEFRWQLLQQAFSAFPDSLFPEAFWTRRAELSTHAAAFWEAAPWLGGGIGSLPLNLWLAGASKAGLVSEGTLNGWWLLLAERGIIGALAFVLPLGFMIATLVLRIIGAMGRHIFMPLPVLGVVCLLATVGVGFVDCSIWRADSLLMTGAFFALAASSFPAPRKTAEDEDVVS